MKIQRKSTKSWCRPYYLQWIV